MYVFPGQLGDPCDSTSLMGGVKGAGSDEGERRVLVEGQGAGKGITGRDG